jgi:mycothiol synthase
VFGPVTARDDHPDLPAGLTARPLTLAEARVAYELLAAEQRIELDGRVEIEEADIVGDWQRPSFDVATRTIGVLDGDRVVGYAELSHDERGEAAVEPSYRGRGIGTWLAAWMRRTARERGPTIVGMPVPEGSAGDRLLTALGYHVRWNSWVLQLPAGARIAERELPAGHVVREARREEHEAAHDVVEDAFLEWSEREREPFAEFRATVLERPGFEPWNLRVVVDETGEQPQVVAVAVVQVFVDEQTGARDAYIARLATRRDRRGEGLAQALMVDSFAAARERGVETAGLNTDSRTGALGLYLRVGMQVIENWVHRAAHLTD